MVTTCRRRRLRTSDESTLGGEFGQQVNPRGGSSLIDTMCSQESEETVRVLTLREEVDDGRHRSTGPDWPAQLRAGLPAGLSAQSQTATPLPRMGTIHNDSAHCETGC